MQRRLIMLLEELDWSNIGAEDGKIPFRAIEARERNSRVVLHNHATVIENEIAHPDETTFEHEIGRGFQEARANPKMIAEVNEPGAGADAAIGDVGGEVIKG